MPPEALTLFDVASHNAHGITIATFDIVAPTLELAPEVYGYRLSPSGRTLSSGWKARALDNIAAIKIARAITTAKRRATPDELDALARFTGFGATELAQSIFPVPGNPIRAGWEEIANELYALVDEAERRALQRSTQYAHYTPDFMTHGIWNALVDLGFDGGRVLEPGCGIGLFMAAAPPAMREKITWIGVEMEPITALIASALQPDATILAQDFTKTKVRTPVDLAIGNPPFAATHVVGEGGCGRMGFRLHDYFIARALEMVRPGGLAAFVTSHGTMDKTSPKAREYIASLASLIGAVRLPQGAMAVEAGTQVVVDVLFFRRGNDQPHAAMPFIDVSEVEPVGNPGEKPMYVNQYFLAHPEMVLGNHTWVTSPVGPVYSCRTSEPGTTQTRFSEALTKLPGIHRHVAALPAPAPTIALTLAPPASATAKTSPPALGLFGQPQLFAVPAPAPRPSSRPTVSLFDLESPGLTSIVSQAASKPTRTLVLALTRAERELDAKAYRHKEGSYCLNDRDQLCQFYDGMLEVVPVKTGRGGVGIFPKAEKTIRSFVAIRNALRAVITAQQLDQPYEDAQTRLRKAYTAFVAEFGPVNLTKITHSIDPDTNEETSTSRQPNIAPLREDPDCWLVASIEKYNVDTNTAELGPMFFERVIKPLPVAVIETADDALAAVLDECGTIDIDRIAAFLRIERAEALAQLGDRVYSVPGSDDEWVTADEYLSGTVRIKLADAEAAAELDPRYQRNVVALRAALPADLNPSDVTARLGSPWIPATDVATFVLETFDIETVVSHTPAIAAWDVDPEPFRMRPSATSEWGTVRRHAGLLMQDALNGSVPQIFDVEHIDGKEVRTLNPIETEAAREKLDKIKTRFSEWIWQDTDRAHRLMRVYNDTYNDLVPRSFDGSHVRLRDAAAKIELYPHQKRVIWRIVASGGTYVAHSVGAGKTMELAAAIMEQRRLGLISKPLLVVPGHCLAQFSREFLQMYPTANILVADEQNFAKEKRDRFVGRATTGNWDCIIITHSAFKFIPSPTAFEQAMIDKEMEQLEDLLSIKKDSYDRTSRKRLEQRKEALRMRLEGLKGRKDDMVTIAEMGIDQIIVDEAQDFRKLSFTTNGGTIKGIDPDGSQRAWDLYVKSRFVRTIRPRRALILASGTPITNTLGEMYTIQRYMDQDELERRNIHEFDAWRAIFGETVTELELQPSKKYKPVTRFAEFVNVPELVSMFRSFADVVQRKDLRHLITLPQVSTGGRQIVTAEATASFKQYQKYLGARIDAIEKRHGKPEPGEDIILSVITDGRHAAVDMRLVDPTAVNEPANKLNRLIENVHRIWFETKDKLFHEPDGTVAPIPGAIQLIFSDIGTVAVGKKRGFSAYEWIREQLIALGVPPNQIAYMQDYKKSSEKQALFNTINAGRVRVLIGSSQTMGTGVNVQRRLKALHHLDVPWLPSEIEQREGRAERQGNENEEIDIFAYATPGSMDAAMWQGNERKARFIGMAMSGDKSIRRLEDAAAQANSFAVAKAISSGNPLLMHKAGLEADIGRLRRLRSAHFDDQHALGSTIAYAKDTIRYNTETIAALERDQERIVSTKGDNFAMVAFDNHCSERTMAGTYLIGMMGRLPTDKDGKIVGSLGGFPVVGRTRKNFISNAAEGDYGIQLSEDTYWLGLEEPPTPVGLVQRLENLVTSIPKKLEAARLNLASAERRLRDATPRLGLAFEHSDELEAKQAELAQVEAELVEESRREEEERRKEIEAEEATKRAQSETAADVSDTAVSTADEIGEAA